MREDKLPHPFEVPEPWHCLACEWQGVAETGHGPTFCPTCGSAYVEVNEEDADGDWDEDDDDDGGQD